MVAEERVVLTGRSGQDGVPLALWVWIGLEALSFVVAPFLRPGPAVFVTTWALVGAFSALL